MAKLMLAPALLMAIQAPSASAAEDFSGILMAPVNGILSCNIVHRADGRHLVINLSKRGVGDAIRVEPDFGYKSFDYIFSSSGKTSRVFNVRSSKLEKSDQIDIPIRTAMGLRADIDKTIAEPIFTKNGTYSIYIGYGFRHTDEAQIFGACSVSLGAK